MKSEIGTIILCSKYPGYLLHMFNIREQHVWRSTIFELFLNNVIQKLVMSLEFGIPFLCYWSLETRLSKYNI